MLPPAGADMPRRRSISRYCFSASGSTDGVWSNCPLSASDHSQPTLMMTSSTYSAGDTGEPSTDEAITVHIRSIGTRILCISVSQTHNTLIASTPSIYIVNRPGCWLGLRTCMISMGGGCELSSKSDVAAACSQTL